jgi:hypothetical protein
VKKLLALVFALALASTGSTAFATYNYGGEHDFDDDGLCNELDDDDDKDNIDDEHDDDDDNDGIDDCTDLDDDNDGIADCDDDDDGHYGLHYDCYHGSVCHYRWAVPPFVCHDDCATTTTTTTSTTTTTTTTLPPPTTTLPPVTTTLPVDTTTTTSTTMTVESSTTTVVEPTTTLPEPSTTTTTLRVCDSVPILDDPAYVDWMRGRYFIHGRIIPLEVVDYPLMHIRITLETVEDGIWHQTDCDLTQDRPTKWSCKLPSMSARVKIKRDIPSGADAYAFKLRERGAFAVPTVKLITATVYLLCEPGVNTAEWQGELGDKIVNKLLKE